MSGHQRRIVVRDGEVTAAIEKMLEWRRSIELPYIRDKMARNITTIAHGHDTKMYWQNPIIENGGREHLTIVPFEIGRAF
jgi:hypothetical protein